MRAPSSQSTASDARLSSRVKQPEAAFPLGLRFTCWFPGCSKAYELKANAKRHYEDSHIGRQIRCQFKGCPFRTTNQSSARTHHTRDHKSKEKFRLSLVQDATELAHAALAHQAAIPAEVQAGRPFIGHHPTTSFIHQAVVASCEQRQQAQGYTAYLSNSAAMGAHQAVHPQFQVANDEQVQDSAPTGCNGNPWMFIQQYGTQVALDESFPIDYVRDELDYSYSMTLQDPAEGNYEGARYE